MDMDFAPYEFDENGKAWGFNIDLWEQIGNNLNKTINFVPMHWYNVMNSLQNGSVDAINAFNTEVREYIMDFSNEILDCKYRIFVRDDVSGITSISDLANHTVAIVAEDASIDHLVKEVPGSYIIEVKTLEEGILKLKNEEVFSFITSHYSGIYYTHKNHIDNIKIIGNEIDLGNYSIAVKKGNTELLGKINNSLQIVIASDFYKNIV
ncbi:MAG: transporter substrate-binding domain-containing protein [Promethearchaeota archaeon]